MDDLTLAGASAWTTTIEQRVQLNRMAETAEGVAVHISGITIKGGNTVGYPGGPDATGGGILNRGALTVDGVTVKGNSAGRAAHGGGIGNYGDLTVLNSTISNNYAVYDGTGIHGGNVTVVNSTISGNTNEGGGAGLWAGEATLRNVTFAANESLSVFVGPGTLSVANTVLQEAPDDQNCYLSGYGAGPVVSLGHNIDSDGSCGLSGPGDLSTVDPQLLPLAGNGGQTLTHALSPASPAIDAGDNAQCPETDQRGVPRPVNGVCDVGAFEFGGVAETPLPTPTPAPWARADLNCNHVVDSFDAWLVLIHITFGGGIFPSCGPPTVAPAERGDINCSGAITAVDALVILRHVAGLPFVLPSECPPLE